MRRVNRIELDDLTLSYADAGQGDPFVLLHGFPLNRSMWKAQLDEFSETHRVIAPDLRGHGGSTVTEGTVTMKTMAYDVAKLLEAVGVDAPITLCGISMGGYVAWELWRQHRDRLAALILCDTRSIADTVEIARARQMMAAQVVEAGPQMAVDAMLPKLLANQHYETRPDLVETIREMILATNPVGIAATQRGMAERIDMTAQLSEIDTPTLLLCGSEDSISPPAEMLQIAEAMPNASFVAIETAGHLAPLEQPAATNAAIQSFLAHIRS